MAISFDFKKISKRPYYFEKVMDNVLTVIKASKRVLTFERKSFTGSKHKVTIELLDRPLIKLEYFPLDIEAKTARLNITQFVNFGEVITDGERTFVIDEIDIVQDILKELHPALSDLDDYGWIKTWEPIGENIELFNKFNGDLVGFMFWRVEKNKHKSIEYRSEIIEKLLEDSDAPQTSETLTQLPAGIREVPSTVVTVLPRDITIETIKPNPRRPGRPALNPTLLDEERQKALAAHNLWVKSKGKRKKLTKQEAAAEKGFDNFDHYKYLERDLIKKGHIKLREKKGN